MRLIAVYGGLSPFSVFWHIGASLKDAGNALFAMMKMMLEPARVLALFE